MTVLGAQTLLAFACCPLLIVLGPVVVSNSDRSNWPIRMRHLLTSFNTQTPEQVLWLDGAFVGKGANIS